MRTVHQVEEDGRGMQPIRYDRDCRRCHPLDADVPELGTGSATGAILVHGDPEKVREQLRIFYTSQVLEGRVEDPKAPRALRERLPGPLIGSEERARSASWIGGMVAAADEELFGVTGCALCHNVLGGEVDAQTGMWIARSVAPVRIQQEWIENARFNHSAHSTQACSTCHPSAAVRDSDGQVEEEPLFARRGAIPTA